MSYTPAVILERRESARATYLARFDESSHKIERLATYQQGLLSQKEKDWLKRSREQILLSQVNKEMRDLAGQAHNLAGQLMAALHANEMPYRGIGSVVGLSIERVRQYVMRYNRELKFAYLNDFKHLPWKK